MEKRVIRYRKCGIEKKVIRYRKCGIEKRVIRYRKCGIEKWVFAAINSETKKWLMPLFFCLKESMRFYIVDDQYIRYLKTIDPKVPDNYNATKPFIGIVLHINEFKYLAPLTSYKQNQENIKSSTPTCVKMHEQGKPTNKLGMIQLNNMIPVLDSVITEFDMNSRDQKYQNLLNNQLVYIKTVRDEIEKKSAKLYRLVEKQVPFYVGMSCDFQALEKACGVYVAAAVAAFTAAAPVVAAPAIAATPAAPEEN